MYSLTKGTPNGSLFIICLNNNYLLIFVMAVITVLLNTFAYAFSVIDMP